MKRPLDKTNKNDVLHDNIDVMDTINYTNRYRFYNAIEAMISQKIRIAAALRANGNAAHMPVIRINLACPDEKPYPKQSERFFHLMNWAAKHGIVLETNVLEPVCLNSWVGRFLRETATPGFRNLYETAYHFYYPQTYNPETKKYETLPRKVIISPNDALAKQLCDFIFLNNGEIKTR